MLTVHSPWSFINEIVSMLALEHLSSDMLFTHVLRDKEVDNSDPEFSQFVDLMTDKFHDHFGLNSEQRAVVKDHLRKTRCR